MAHQVERQNELITIANDFFAKIAPELHARVNRTETGYNGKTGKHTISVYVDYHVIRAEVPAPFSALDYFPASLLMVAENHTVDFDQDFIKGRMALRFAKTPEFIVELFKRMLKQAIDAAFEEHLESKL